MPDGTPSKKPYVALGTENEKLREANKQLRRALKQLQDADGAQREIRRLRKGARAMRRRVEAACREWERYPASYPRSAFIEDIRAALEWAERVQ